MTIPSPLCLALEERKSDSARVGTEAPNRLFMKGVGLFLLLLLFILFLDFSLYGLPDINIASQQ